MHNCIKHTGFCTPRAFLISVSAESLAPGDERPTLRARRSHSFALSTLTEFLALSAVAETQDCQVSLRSPFQGEQISQFYDPRSNRPVSPAYNFIIEPPGQKHITNVQKTMQSFIDVCICFV